MSTFDVKNIRGKNMSRLYAYFIIPDESDLSWANRSRILRQMQTSAEIDSKVHIRASTSFMRQEREIVARIDAKRSSEMFAINIGAWAAFSLSYHPRTFSSPECRVREKCTHERSRSRAESARALARVRCRSTINLTLRALRASRGAAVFSRLLLHFISSRRHNGQPCLMIVWSRARGQSLARDARDRRSRFCDRLLGCWSRRSSATNSHNGNDLELHRRSAIHADLLLLVAHWVISLEFFFIIINLSCDISALRHFTISYRSLWFQDNRANCLGEFSWNVTSRSRSIRATNGCLYAEMRETRHVSRQVPRIRTRRVLPCARRGNMLAVFLRTQRVSYKFPVTSSARNPSARACDPPIVRSCD